ncbi:MAG: hypothetical protein ACI9SI_001241 [Polaribacter sp.]|jgi:uncharacterized protein (TIGR01777 family)
MNILITGGTGLVGQLLQQKLVDMNYTVRILSRNPKKATEFYWNIANNEIDEKAFIDVEYIIHLAGAGIAEKRWTPKRKQEIMDSRIKSTALLFNKVKQLKTPLKGFIAASAIGYYGAITSENIFKESDPAATDFIGNVCQQWEQASLAFNDLQIPTTILRTGIVLSKNGGALSKMNTPIAINPIGNGKHYIPWVHIEDLTNLFIKAIEDNTFTGIYNAVAPETQTSFSFAKTLAKKTKKLYIPLGIPSFLLQLLFGEMSIILTTGSRISSEKIENSGFYFIYKNLDKALENSVQKP